MEDSTRRMIVKVTDEAGTDLASWPVDVLPSGTDEQDARRAISEAIVYKVWPEVTHVPMDIHERITQSAKRVRARKGEQ